MSPRCRDCQVEMSLLSQVDDDIVFDEDGDIVIESWHEVWECVLCGMKARQDLRLTWLPKGGVQYGREND